MKILMVLTSHSALGDTGRKTGYWLEELATPYYRFRDAGADVTLASPLGGEPPQDPASVDPATHSEPVDRFEADITLQHSLRNTRMLIDVQDTPFDALLYVGGHGPLWDLVDSVRSIALIESFWRAGKPVAAVCHGPAAFRHVKVAGEPLVKGRRVTGFSDTEEAAVGLTQIVPFSLEQELVRLGGAYSKAPDWQSHVCVDGMLVTGQNPASSFAVADAVLKLLG